MVTAIGGGYFGVSHKLSFTDGPVRYLLSEDAQRTAVALNRLLNRAAVLKPTLIDEPGGVD